jgi:hypothetical protein
VADHGRGATLGFSAVLSLLAILFCADLVLVTIHLAQPYFEALRPRHFSLEADRGIAEYYQYLKQAIVVLAMLWCWRRTKAPSFFVWSLFFALMLYDDSHSLHEGVGEDLAAAWALPGVFGLRPQDLGELLFAAAVGVLTVSLLLAVNAFERGAAAAHTLNVVLLLAALAVCGVLVDAIHVIAYFSGSRLAWVLAVIEDGGELLIMSLITAYAGRLAVYGLRARLPLPLDVGRLLRGSFTGYQAAS